MSSNLQATLTSPRRIVTAVVIVLLLGVGAVGVTGMAAASDGGEAVSTPPRMVGDRIRYEVSSAPQDPVTSESSAGAHGSAQTRSLEFEQKQMQRWKDSNGTWRAADGIAWIAGSVNGEPIQVDSYLDAETWEPLAASTGVGMTAGSSSQEEQTTRTYRYQEGQTWHLCGLVHDLQGTPPRDSLQAAGCAGGEDLLTDFRLHATTTLGGESVYVFTEVGGSAELWLQQGIPYPIRISTERGETREVLDLVGFERGDQALQHPDLPPPTAMPVVVPVGRPDVAVDMNGLDIAYPMHQAIEEAREDPTFPELRDWLAAHPEAVVTTAAYQADEAQQIWAFQWHDETAGFRLHISRQQNAGAAVTDALGLPDQEASWDVRRSVFEMDRGWHLAPAAWPAQAPAAGDAVAAWQAYAETTRPPQAFAFHAPACDTCPLRVLVGDVWTMNHISDGSMDLFQPAVEEREDGVGLEFDENGAIVAILRSQRTYRNDGGPLAPPMQSAGPSTGPTADRDASTWSPPPTTAATTIGLGALLVGLLYWAWPVAKTVPAFGLRWFRRGPDILENPARRSIHSLVKDEPGIHYQAIVKKVGLGHGAVEHHLRRLVEAGQLKRVRSNGYTCYFGLDTDQRAAAAAGVLKAAGARQVMAAIRSNPGASVSDIAQETGLSPGTVSHHLRRLRAGGVVESWRDGRSVRLRASALAMMLA